MEDWKEYSVQELIDKGMLAAPMDGNHGEKHPKTGDYVPTGIPFIMANNLIGGTIDYKNCAFISKTQANSLDKGFAKPGDVLLTHKATIGRTAIVPDDYDFIVLTPQVTYYRPLKGIDNSFLKYYFDTVQFQSLFKNWAGAGSTRAYLGITAQRKLPIVLPNLGTQKKISSILKSLDDKIEVNRRINENLEQQAQALFKSWFVDFEPFKDGEYVESELGMIPKGWRVGKLGELCQFKRGKGLLSKNAIPGDVPVVAGGLEPSCYHNVSNTKAPVITVSGSGANAGFMRMYHQEVWASDCSFIDISCVNWLFVYCFLAINSHLLRHAQTGAVQPHVKPADIHDFDLVIPPKENIQRFQDKISSFITKKGLIEQESRRLASLRDTLLPKLMSGELKVNEVY